MQNRFNHWRILIISLALFFLAGTFGTTSLAASGLELEWENTMGSYQLDRGYSATQMADGCYIVVGETFSKQSRMHGSGGYDVYLVKVGPKGDMRWQFTYGGARDDSAVSVQLTDNDGFIIAGTTKSYSDQKDTQLYLIKTEVSGNKKWQGVFGGDGEEAGAYAVQTADGGYIVIGESNSFGAGGYDMYLVKTDDRGKMEWEKTFGGKQDDQGVCVQQTEDGGYILTGQTESFGARGYNLYLVKTDFSGALEWETTIGGEGWDIPETIAQTDDGGYIVTGRTSSFNSGNFDLYLVKTDGLGNIEWEQAFGAKGWDMGKTVQQTVDGGYLTAGFTDSLGDGELAFYLVKTNAYGKQLWDKTLASDKYDERFSIQGTDDGDYIIAGWWADRLKYESSRSEEVQVYVAKIKARLDAGSAPVVKQQDEENNGQNVMIGSLTIDVPLVMQDNRVLVPFRPIAEALGAEVSWDAQTQTVTMTAGERTVELAIGSTAPLVNGEPTAIDVPAGIYYEQTYVPLRFVGDALGAEVKWDNETKTVSIVTEP
ncbi:MAG TPA: hypothetical protein DEF34_01415 [Desulfotomaculum sp.]|nr:hypothetical protein [Desulfotomaculum sp.]